MSEKKIFLKHRRGAWISLLALFLLSSTFFPAIEALASPEGFEVLKAEFEKVDGDTQLNLTLERNGRTAEDIIGTLRFPEDYNEENLTLEDPVQSWGTMSRHQITFRIYMLHPTGTVLYPETLLLDLVYSVRGRQYDETLFLDVTWSWQQEMDPGTDSFYPEIDSFSASSPNKGSASTFTTNVKLFAPRQVCYTISKIQYEISTSDYSDYDFWTKEYGVGQQICGLQDVDIIRSMGPFLYEASAPSEIHYALNVGDFSVDTVKISGTPYFVDTYYPGGPGDFTVQSSNVVFPITLIDPAWEVSLLGDGSDFLSSAVTLDFKENTTDPGNWISTNFQDEFDQSFMAYESVWTPDATSHGMCWVRFEDVEDTVGDLLDISGGWNSIQYPNDGTHYDNHGFDIAIGYTGNISNVEGGCASVSMPGETALTHVVVGNVSGENSTEEAFWIWRMKTYGLHELLHSYGAYDPGDHNPFFTYTDEDDYIMAFWPSSKYDERITGPWEKKMHNYTYDDINGTAYSYGP